MQEVSKKDNKLRSDFNFKIRKEILDWIICIIIAITLALLFRYFIITPTIVNMVSMNPTLESNDRLLLNRTIRISKKMPNRGEIITFEANSKKKYTSNEINQENPIAEYKNEPNNLFYKFIYYVLELGKESYIKRVIGLPNEHIKIKEGKIYVNNIELQEEYLEEGVTTEVMDTALHKGFDDFIVPENCVFALGDNRNHSTDCRDFGCIPLDKIEGIAFFRFFPFDKIGNIY